MWERRLSDGDAFLKDAVYCALTNEQWFDHCTKFVKRLASPECRRRKAFTGGQL